MTRLAVGCFLISTLLYQHGCRPSPQNSNYGDSGNTLIRMAPDERSAMVFLFKRGITIGQQTQFLDNVLSSKLEGNRGTWPLPGMSSTFRIQVEDYDGYAIDFQKYSTPEQKAVVKEKLEQSPLIYKVYENTRPDQIHP